MSVPTLDELIRDLDRTPVSGLPGLLSRAFEAGRATEQEHIADAKMQIADALRSMGVVIEPVRAPAPGASALSEDRAYGEVVRIVRGVVDKLDTDRPFEILDVQTRLIGQSVEKKQIHNALKGLIKQGHIMRTRRGQYMRVFDPVDAVVPPASQDVAGPATPNQGDLPMTQNDAS